MEEIGGVVVEEDAGENVLRGVVGDGLVEVFGVGRWEVVEKEMGGSAVQDKSVQEHQGEVSGGFRDETVLDPVLIERTVERRGI